MITYKYKIQNDIDIIKWLRPFNNVVRYSYNRFRDNPKYSIDEVVRLVQNNMNNIEYLDFSLLRYAVLKASLMKDKSNIIFGSKKLFNMLKNYDLKNSKLSKEDIKSRFNDKRYNKPLFLRGCCSDSKGNRKAKLDIIDNNSIILQFDRKNHINVKLPNLNKKRKKDLSKLQDLCNDNKACFSIEVNNEHIYIIFDEKYIKNNKKYSFKKNRILSFDLNPNYIGLTICDWLSEDRKNIIYKEIIDITKLNSLPDSKYKKNKRDYETSMINKHIVDLSISYKCELISFEKLNIKSKNYNNGRDYNRLLNNCWNRRRLINNLKKRCNINSIKYQEVIACYSSFIGQIQHEDEIDSIAASLEISRRSYKYKKDLENNLKPKNIVYPKFNIHDLSTHWKKMINIKDVKNWKELYDLFKESDFRYRILFALKNFQGISFSLKSPKSLTMIRFV